MRYTKENVMHRMLLSAVAVLALLGTAAGRADTAIATRPAASSPSEPSEADRVRAEALAQQSVDLLMKKKPDVLAAEAKLRQAIAILPEKAVFHYNLACILAMRGQTDQALNSLERATECGFTDFSILESDPDLDSLRGEPRLAQILSRKRQIAHAAGERALAELKRKFGDGYRYAVDEDQKLVFAADTDQTTLDALRGWIVAQENSQEAALFSHKPDEFIRIVVPSRPDYRRVIHTPGVRGMYVDQTRTLYAEHLGQVMTHEFTHALHSADQRAYRQEHPIWLREGLASMYEAGDFVDGKLIPRDNFRLASVQMAARRNGLYAFAKLLRLQSLDFTSNPDLAYGESSSLLLYLHEKKQLREFYDAYKASYDADATGQVALESTTGMTLTELEQAWKKWMLARPSPAPPRGPGGPSMGVNFKEGIDGLNVTVILPNSPAARAGVKLGDILVGIDERPSRDYLSLWSVLAQHKAGDPVTLHVRRGEAYLNVKVVLGAR